MYALVVGMTESVRGEIASGPIFTACGNGVRIDRNRQGSRIRNSCPFLDTMEISAERKGLDSWRVFSRTKNWIRIARRCRVCERGLRGDLNQMTDEALRWDNAGGTGNLSNVPLHMADLGTDNYDQEFTLGLIENEQGTLELVNEALNRMENGTLRPMRGVRRADLEAAAPGDPLCAALHSRVHGSWRVANEDGRGSGSRPACCFSGRSPWAGPRSIWRPSRSSSPESALPPLDRSDRAQHPRAAHQSEYRCALGLRGRAYRAAA